MVIDYIALDGQNLKVKV